MLLPALMSRISGGTGAAGPQPGGPPSSAPGSPAGGINPEAIGAAVSQEYSQLQNVDPGKIVADLQKYKQGISALFPVAVERVADAAKGISQAVTGLNSAIKAFEKAQETLKNVHPPLGLQSAQQQPGTGATPFGPQMGGPVTQGM
jgi:hypothetical protein